MKNLYFLNLVLFCLASGLASAQYSVIHSFNFTNGAQPYGSLTLSGNTMFGMTSSGGIHKDGCIFSMNINGSGYKDLFDFDGTNGSFPYSGALTLSGNTLYGMTIGIYTDGNIFSIDTNGSGFKDLMDFDSITGQSPYGSLTLSGGILYGMTSQGGANGKGCVFSISTNGSGYKDLVDFSGANGSMPYGDLTLLGNILYGMTSSGGLNNDGCIFSVQTNGSGFKKLLDFSGANGMSPLGSLTLSGNTLYGMAEQGGAHTDGCIFSIDTAGSGYKDLLDFNGINGQYPWGSLTLSGTTLYGMTYMGGASGFMGVIFSIDTNGAGYKKMFDFNGTMGEGPKGSLTLSGNTLYGMASYAEPTDTNGVIFKIDTSSLASINELNTNNNSIKLYPNPNNGQFTIRLPFANDHSIVAVYDMLGEKVYSKEFSTFNSQLSIDIGSKCTGVYLYRIITETGALVSEGKFVIE